MADPPGPRGPSPRPRFALAVPGLAEKKPLVLPGDVLRLRPVGDAAEGAGNRGAGGGWCDTSMN